MTNKYNSENKIIIGRVGAYCGSIRYEKEKFWATDNTIIASPLKDNIKFMFYLFQTLNLNYYAGGSAQPLLTQRILNPLRIKLPAIKTQEKIAHVLSTYDELIENNNRRIEILEEMAEEIYREWFVRMRFPGHENTKFIKGIPEGWEVTKFINKKAELIKTGVTKFTGYKQYLATADVEGNTIIGGVDVKYKERPSRANMKIVENSIWFAKMQNTTKHLYGARYTKELLNDVIISTGFAGVKCTQLYFYYYLCFIRFGSFEKIKDTFANGSTQVAINNKNIQQIPILLPNEETLSNFETKIEPIFKLIYEYRQQNQNLISQRDMLLPRLMNNTIQVK